jgi:hypothetical protein
MRRDEGREPEKVEEDGKREKTKQAENMAEKKK